MLVNWDKKGGNKWLGEVDYQEPLTGILVDYSHSLLTTS